MHVFLNYNLLVFEKDLNWTKRREILSFYRWLENFKFCKFQLLIRIELPKFLPLMNS